MAETHADITLNEGSETESYETVAARLDHLDCNMHEVMQAAERIEKHLEAITGALADAKPLIEKWQHSTIARLARGQMPWQQG